MRSWSAFVIALGLQPVTWFLWMLAADVDQWIIPVMALAFLAGAAFVSLFSVKVTPLPEASGFEGGLQVPGEAEGAARLSRFWPIRIVHGVGALFLFTHLVDNGIRDWAPSGIAWILMACGLLLQVSLVVAAKPAAQRMHKARVNA